MTDTESDRISCLPDHIIDKILSRLPIKEAGKTSVLSSKWSNKWTTQSNLVFDRQCVSAKDPSVIKTKFLRIIDHVLLLHSGPINKVKISDSSSYFIDIKYVADIDRWILHLTKRSIKKFVLDFWLEQRYKIPWCLFSCQSLHCLKLYWCSLNPPTRFEGFRNLKSLHLEQVTTTQDAFEKLISGSPLLEKLKVFNVDAEIKLPTPCINLTTLHISINFNDLKQISAVLFLLNSSPNLLVFKIIADQADHLTSVSYCWEDIFSEPVMPLKLQHVTIHNISGTKSELDFIRFILLHSPVLRRMTVKPVINVTSKLTTELIRFRRVSAHAEVIYDVKDSS